MWILGERDISAQKQCSITPKDAFENPREFEDYLRSKEPFSQFESLPIAGCTDLENTDDSKKKVLIAEYYNNSARLAWSLQQSLNAAAGIDSLLGKENFLKDINCDGFLAVSKNLKSECSSLKKCSSSPANLQSTSKDTIQALNTIKLLKQELKKKENSRKLQNRRSRVSKEEKNKLKNDIQTFKQAIADIQQLYPWILGKTFKDNYDETKHNTPEKMAGLIKKQLPETRKKLKEKINNVHKLRACVIDGYACKENNIDDDDYEKLDTALAGSPALNPELIFGSPPASDEEWKKLSGNEKQALKQSLPVRSYFEQVECRQQIRQDVSYVQKEASLLAVNALVTVPTVGLAGAVIAGKFAFRGAGHAMRVQRAKNLSFIGMDLGFSAPLINEASKDCQQYLNKVKLETTETAGNTCTNFKTRTQHTKDLKSCILQTIASLPISAPLLTGSAAITAVRAIRARRSLPRTPAVRGSAGGSRSSSAKAKKPPISKKAVIAIAGGAGAATLIGSSSLPGQPPSADDAEDSDGNTENSGPGSPGADAPRAEQDSDTDSPTSPPDGRTPSGGSAVVSESDSRSSRRERRRNRRTRSPAGIKSQQDCLKNKKRLTGHQKIVCSYYQEITSLDSQIEKTKFFNQQVQTHLLQQVQSQTLAPSFFEDQAFKALTRNLKLSSSDDAQRRLELLQIGSQINFHLPSIPTSELPSDINSLVNSFNSDLQDIINKSYTGDLDISDYGLIHSRVREIFNSFNTSQTR